MNEKEARELIFNYISSLPANKSTYQSDVARNTGLSKPTAARHLDVMFYDGTLKDMLLRTKAGKMVVYIKK